MISWIVGLIIIFFIIKWTISIGIWSFLKIDEAREAGKIREDKRQKTLEKKWDAFEKRHPNWFDKNQS